VYHLTTVVRIVVLPIFKKNDLYYDHVSKHVLSIFYDEKIILILMLLCHVKHKRFLNYHKLSLRFVSINR